MRRALLVSLAATLLAPAAAYACQARMVPPPMECGRAVARVMTCTVTTSSAKVRDRSVRVVLPEGYRRGRSYPVVYLLHGVGDDETTWTNPARGNLAALTQRCDAIFVTPDGGSGREAGWYSDWADGRYEWERFHVTDLPEAVDATFRTTGSQAVAGLSMGGFGAMSYASRHPGRYAAAASYSGFLDTMFGAPASGAAYHHSGQNGVYSTGAPNDGVWGEQAANEATWRAHNPWDQVGGLRDTALYVSGGTGVHPDPAKAPANAVEAYTRVLTDRFAERLAGAGIAFTDGRYAGGTHDWPEWRAAFSDSLSVLMPAVGARPC